ncbi:MAG: T9SS type A sorting domain-containing protein, partial [Bacteroidales bacterium]|nr:T9SS type A sorting domain-containing protein [Bacteroidales bacterium]
SGGIAIGRKGETELGYFNGKIDDCKLYNHALSVSEINSIYHEGGWPMIDGLVAHYPFNSNANDESGNGNDGIVNGATLTTDRFGNENSAYSFDGVDDYIHIPFSEDFDFDPSGQFTLNAWAYTNVLNVSHHIITKSPPNTMWDYGLTIDNNNLFLFGHHAQHEAYSTTQAQINEWFMVTGVYENSNWKIYIDRILENDNTASSITQSSGGIAIGRKGETELGNFNGKIVDICVFNKALSQNEIDSIYDSTTNIDKIEADCININLFPNPNNGEFNIKLQNNIENDIHIYSLDGKLIYSNKFKNSCELNLKNLEKGIYLVKVVSNDYIETKKLIIE